MKLGKIVEGALGVFLMLPGPEDVATGGLALGPSFLLGSILLLDAVGIRMPKI